MTALKLFFVALFIALGLPFLFSVSAAENAPVETAEEFYQRRIEQASQLKQEAERQVRYHDIAQKYRELVEKAVAWEKEGIDRYGFLHPDLPRPGGDAYFKSRAMEEYAEYLGLDYGQQIELADDPNKKFSLLQEWTNKALDYVNAAFNSTWDTRVVDYKDVTSKLSLALGDSIRGVEVDIGKGTDVPGLDVLADLFRKVRDYAVEIVWFEHDPEQGSVFVAGRHPGAGVARKIFDQLDEQIRGETDPLQRFELLRERIKKTKWVFKTAHGSGGVFDERVIPELGGRGLGESKILKEQSIAIVEDLKKLIDNESDAQTKKHLAERLVDIVRWLKKEWDKADYDDYYRPDMSDWPDSIDDLIDTSSLPAGPQLPAVTSPKQPAATPASSKCNFNGFLQCRDKFNLQGCIDACPYVPTTCPPGTSPDTDCKQTDQGCSDACWDRGNTHGSQCAKDNNCTMQEIDARLRQR